MEIKRSYYIREKIAETADAGTLVLEPADGLPLHYRAGQYLPLILTDQHGHELRRAYSFSSTPGIDSAPAITIKRIPNGEVSNRLLYHTLVGDQLAAQPPAGRFVLPDTLPHTLVYLAAGSGITPVFSHLKQLFQQAEGPQVVLYYANRDEAGTIFKRQIDGFIQDFPNRFSCTYFYSREKNSPNSHFGHINNTLFENLVAEALSLQSDKSNTAFFLCAPRPLTRMAVMTLKVMGFKEEQIFTETFVPDTRLPARVINPDIRRRVSVTRDNETVEFEVFEGETILNAALRQGISLPYTCKSGVCLSCLAKCVNGQAEVAYVHETIKRHTGDWVNTCIGYAVTDQLDLSLDSTTLVGLPLKTT